MRIRTFVTAASLTALAAATSVQAQLRSYSGVVAGNATVGPQFQCATSGYTIGAPWFAGLLLPTEGIAACGLNGQVQNLTGNSGPLTTSAAASGPMASVGTFSGTAKARANYWNLGVAASGTSTGDASTFTYRQAASFASFAEDVIYTSPDVVNGTAGLTNFKFFVDGFMRNLPVAPYGQQGDIALSFSVNNLLWTAFSGTTFGNNLPNVRGGSTGLPGNFILVPGQFSGSANITTTGNFNFVWGTPLRIEVGLYTSISPCCFGASINSDFYNSAVLTGVDAYAGNSLITNFVATTSSGLRLNAQGVIAPQAPVTTVPEPGTYGMMLLGLASVALLARRRTRSR